ncbi:MAG: hypothetical protein JXA66_01795 [Oligoflexia bacterium]|nr:hypothetical protein [Oligoflexia bacterium]
MKVIVIIILSSLLNTHAALCADTPPFDLENWEHAYHLKLNFDTYHPQGLIKMGKRFYLSTYDMDNEQGYVIEFDGNGNQTNKIKMGKKPRYHTSGLDSDGRYIWIAMSERRKNSTAEFFIIEPETMKVEPVTDWNGNPYVFDDHIGTLAFDVENNLLIGFNWDSVNIYTWDFSWSSDGVPSLDAASVKKYRNAGGVAYQDCKYFSFGEILCCGYDIRSAPGKGLFHGIPALCEKLNCAKGRVDELNAAHLDKVPVPRVDASIYPVKYMAAYNAFWYSSDKNYLFFVPENDTSYLEGYVNPNIPCSVEVDLESVPDPAFMY